MTGFIARLRTEPCSDFGLDFADFPGCVTAGKTREDARHQAAAAKARLQRSG
jgi:predicted RNase H-like HicB family nuclease